MTNTQGGRAYPKYVKKTWGSERHYKNDEQYCMKLLHIEDRGSTSMHFHRDKHETLLVVSGLLTLTITHDNCKYVHILKPGDAWDMVPGMIHTLEAKAGPVNIVEASTFDHPSDTVRTK
jgi:quercetin dioxygenase-like cupin family protein